MTEILNKNPLFAGLTGAELEGALAFFDAQRRQYGAGETLQQVGDPLPRFGLLLRGAVQVSMNDLDGSRLLMASVTPGDTFGESLAFLQAAESPVWIHAVRDSDLLWLDPARVRAGAKDRQEQQLCNRFTALLAMRALSMNDRIQILSKTTLRRKLNTLFAEQVRKTGRRTFTLPFDREALAAYLGTDRSALSRELSRMKAEGLIDFFKNDFQLLK